MHHRILRPDAVRDQCSDHEMHEGRRQTSRKSAHAGSRLKLKDDLGRSRLTGQPSSRTGENPPYGMIGGIEETSASLEARSAPRSYPTRRSGARPHRARAAKPRVSCRRGFQCRRSHGRRAAGCTPAASRDSVPTAGGTAAVSEGLPRHATAASSRAMGGRYLSAASRILRGSCQGHGCAVAFGKSGR